MPSSSTSQQPKRGRFAAPQQMDESGNDFFVNPITVGIELLKLLTESNPDYLPLIQPANPLELLSCRELYTQFCKIQNECNFVDDDIVDEDCEGAPCNHKTKWTDETGQSIQSEKFFIPIEEKIQILAKLEPFWGKRSFTWIQRHGRSKLKQFNYKAKWENHISCGGTRFEKYKLIDDYVWDKFQESRKELRSIHYYDLKRWALQRAAMFPEVPGFTFVASQHWIDSFKQRHKITSRKITRLVTQREIVSSEALQNRAEIFRKEIKDSLEFYNPDQVLNWDQTGCNYEIVSARTLTLKGEPVTYGFARSPTNRVTHSYTVQHTISLSGNVCGPAFVCLQEQSGRFGPRVQQTVFEAENVLVTCSHSGKLTTSLLEYFLDNGLVPHVKIANKDVLLCFDHWTAQVDPVLYHSRFGENGVPSCEIHMIPERCTPVCQPLDTVYNRQFKYLLKRIAGQVQLEHEDSDDDAIHSRNNILKMQSLLHYQLSAAIFRPMIRYAWFKAGISDNKESFLNVKEACFSFQSRHIRTCESDNCLHPIFIQCSRCRTCLCFQHFFHEYHKPGPNCVDIQA